MGDGDCESVCEGVVTCEGELVDDGDEPKLGVCDCVRACDTVCEGDCEGVPDAETV